MNESIVSASDSPKMTMPPVAALPSPRRASPRLLVVEDHADTARAMQVMLRHFGYEVSVAADAEAALRLAAAVRFDLVVSDIGLPGTDGYSLMRQLRDRFGLRGVALSGYGGEADAAACREAGYSFSLVKPVDLDRLDLAIRLSLPD